MLGRLRRLTVALFPVLAAIFVASCQNSDSVGPQIVSLSITSGDGQTGAVGATLTQALVVKAKNQDGVAAAGVPLTWEPAVGGATILASSATTDANGNGQATVRLGGSLGAQSVAVSIQGDSKVTFNLLAAAAPASQISPSAGDQQSGKVGAKLVNNIVATVTDAVGNAKAGVSVTFAVGTGGGSLSASSAVTDAGGLASVSWTLGTTSGTQTIIASVPGVSPATFHATATPDDAVIISIVGGNNQSAPPGAPLQDSLAVTVRDQYGNGVSGVTVVWAPGTLLDGTLSPSSSVTDPNGRATTRWTIGGSGGPKSALATSGQIPAVRFFAAGQVSYVSISAGSRHTCALGVGGVLYCWGFNGDGQLGIGQAAQGAGPVFAFPQPTAASGNFTFGQVSAGRFHNCALTLSGIAFCWGNNVDGRLGDGTTTTSNTPVIVKGTITYSMVTAGRVHSCALSLPGRAYCWGSNAEGELGVIAGPAIPAESLSLSTPVPINTNALFKTISAGGLHACAVGNTGAAMCWGYNANGQLGNGSFGQANSPVVVAGGLAFDSISAGYSHTCGLTHSGTAYCWGNNAEGQIGDGTVVSSLIPTPVGGGLTFSAISAGLAHTCGIVVGGTVYCWGRNSSGQLGDGTTNFSPLPVAVDNSLVFTSIGAGDLTSCGVTSSNIAYCWGDNQYGQLGDNSTTNRVAPTRVAFQP